jgi:hypothetical protein
MYQIPIRFPAFLLQIIASRPINLQSRTVCSINAFITDSADVQNGSTYSQMSFKFLAAVTTNITYCLSECDAIYLGR